MAQTAFVRARIDQTLKDDAAAVLEQMGLTVSDLVRITLTRVARDGAVPFDLKVPNAETAAAMREARQLAKAANTRFATAEEVFDALDRKVVDTEASKAAAGIQLRARLSKGLGSIEPDGSVRHGAIEGGDAPADRQRRPAGRRVA